VVVLFSKPEIALIENSVEHLFKNLMRQSKKVEILFIVKDES
jgi:hypothetical protein